MPPDAFWRLHPAEFWWIVEAQQPTKTYGHLREDEMADLWEDMQQMEEK